jgi:hypothetical protein
MYNICSWITSLINNTATMDVNGFAMTEKMKHEIQLVKGDFTPSEASDVIMALLDEKINFHQIQRLQKWEQNHSYDSVEIDDRITQLEKEKEAVKEFLVKMESLKSKLSVNGILEITIADNQ